MKKILFIIALSFACTQCTEAFTSWENSPNNWNNSPNNPNANLIYDNYGNAQGYAVPKSNGTGVNVYDFDGKRRGYYNY